MTRYPATSTCTHILRPLGKPRPMLVEVEDGVPVHLVIDGIAYRVTCVEDSWTVEKELWQQRISRRHFTLMTDDGTHHSIYHDRVADRWYAQDA